MTETPEDNPSASQTGDLPPFPMAARRPIWHGLKHLSLLLLATLAFLLMPPDYNSTLDGKYLFLFFSAGTFIVYILIKMLPRWNWLWIDEKGIYEKRIFSDLAIEWDQIEKISIEPLYAHIFKWKIRLPSKWITITEPPAPFTGSKPRLEYIRGLYGFDIYTLLNILTTAHAKFRGSGPTRHRQVKWISNFTSTTAPLRAMLPAAGIALLFMAGGVAYVMAGLNLIGIGRTCEGHYNDIVQKGRTDKVWNWAQDDCKKILTATPDSFFAFAVLGYDAFRKGNFEAAAIYLSGIPSPGLEPAVTRIRDEAFSRGLATFRNNRYSGANRYFGFLAKLNDPRGFLGLARIHGKKDSGFTDYQKSINYLFLTLAHPAVTAEQKGAVYHDFGIFAKNGHVFAKSIDLAKTYFELGIQEGSKPARWQLALIRELGPQHLRDTGEAIDHYKVLMNAGILPAQYRLGRIYLTDKGRYHDEAEGKRLIRDAAAKGDKHAKAYLEKLGP